MVTKKKRGRQSFRRPLNDRDESHPNYANKFGHLEGDTIIGKNHKSSVITLVERISKAKITIKYEDGNSEEVESRLTKWVSKIPRISLNQ